MTNLEDIANEVHAAAQRLEAATAKRDKAIRAELRKTNGAGPTELARLFGLTRARIHQIRDNRR